MLYPATKNDLEKALENYSIHDISLEHMASSISFQRTYPSITDNIRRSLWHIPGNRQRLSRPFVTSVIAYLIRTNSIVF